MGDMNERLTSPPLKGMIHVTFHISVHCDVEAQVTAASALFSFISPSRGYP